MIRTELDTKPLPYDDGDVTLFAFYLAGDDEPALWWVALIREDDSLDEINLGHFDSEAAARACFAVHTEG